MRATTPFARPLPGLVAGLALLAAAGWLGCTRQPTAPEGSGATAAPEPPAGLEYVPPEPGTYELPPIQRTADGAVLDTAGRPHRLADFLGDRYVVMSFVYTSCADPRACPMARMVFGRLHRRLQEHPELAGRVRLVTLSFDPERDTPEAMAEYAGEGGLLEDRTADSWVFLTTEGQEELQPILDAYGQLVVPEIGPDGRFTGTFAHMLKVFLIDRDGRVRNVYSSDFLHPELVLADLETLHLEAARRTANATARAAGGEPREGSG